MLSLVSGRRAHTAEMTRTPVGTVTRDASGVLLQLRAHLPVAVDVAWAALTDPGQLGRWFGTWTGDPGTGQVVLTSVEGGGPAPVHLRVCEPPHRLDVELASPDGAWPLSVRLAPQDGGCTVQLVHRLVEPYDAGSVGPGWQYYLDRLAAVVTGEPVPTDWEAYAALAPAYAVPPG